MSLRVSIYHAFDKEIKHIWSSLEQKCDNYVFQSYEWLSHWYDTIGNSSEDIRPYITVVFKIDQPLALFPFVIKRERFISVLEFMGGVQNDYNSPLVTPEMTEPEKFRSLWDAVIKALPRHDVRYFVRIPEHLGGVHNPLLDVDSSTFQEGVSYSSTLPDNWETYKQRLSSKFSKDNARMYRRLSEIGEVEVRIAENEEAYKYILDEIIKQKRLQYKETGAIDYFSDPNICDFYRKLWRNLDSKNLNHTSALILDGIVLASHFGMAYKGRYYYLIPAYSRGKFEKFSPGRLLLESLVKWAILNNQKEFDFTCGAESYKNIWCDSKMLFYRTVRPLTLKGYLYSYKKNIIHWCKTNPCVRSLAMSSMKKIYAIKK